MKPAYKTTTESAADTQKIFDVHKSNRSMGL